MQNVIVVGAGIWGASLALRLAESGRRVTLIERLDADDPRRASAGETRLVRSAHGTSEFYSQMAWESTREWLALNERVGEQIFLPQGLMWFGREADGWEVRSAEVLKDLDIPCTLLDPAEAALFYPEMRHDDLATVLYEPEAGVVRARRATEVVTGLAQDAGVTLVRGTARPAGRGVVVDGERTGADQVVWACGAWLPGLFHGLPITVTRQDTTHFAADWTGVPAFCDYSGSAYGHGDIDGHGMKITSDVEGEPGFDPESPRGEILAASEQRARDYLARRFPSLAEVPLGLTQVCQYALTPDAEWVVAEIEDGVWVMGGDSGHGFKHAPVLAARLTSVLNGEAAVDPRFGLHPRESARGLRTSGET
ncbi:NAD(P)/FAD-dependent oxidoreductase [Herbidospora galbida]|uniref:NAD(P)/FAD-dependent oxidoreductase n=1 Tax=Herbidospora galbida TaxID=2575442 RepID=UPI00148501BE|nr:FAD-dependent oxidoreductase [Herbidospora galbida]